MSHDTTNPSPKGARRRPADAGKGGGPAGPARTAQLTEPATSVASTVARPAPTVDWVTPGTDPTVHLPPEADDEPPPIELDRAIDGRYCLEHELGRGGFGVVYLAYDRELQRQVAIKITRCTGGRTVEELLEEGRKLARLDHPHIVPVYDCGRIDDRTIYLVSKYVDGGSLSRRMALRTFPIEEAVRIALQVAEALAHAHERDLIHRDLKPSNILLDSRGVVYVADFGLAMRSVDRSDHRCVEGSPLYMSPEQANGKSRLVDRRTDVFSFGVLLFELLTGRRPFPGRSAADYREQVIHEEPPPPRRFKPEIPEALERICLKALEKDPKRRHSSAWELARDLRAWDEGRGAGGEAGPGDVPAGAGWPWERCVRLGLLVAAFLLLLAAAVAWALRPYVVGPAAPPLARAEPEPARPDLEAARRIVERGGKVDFDGDIPEISSIAQFPERPGALRGAWLYKVKPVTPEEVAALADLDGLSYLNLSDTALGDDGAAEVARMAGLRRLWIGYNPLTDRGAVLLGALTGLDQLGLAETKVTDVGVEAICAAGGLIVLELSGTGVTDRGLARVGELSGLRHLFLNGTAITDAGVEHLLKLSELEVLEIRGTGITPGGIARLEAGLPGCAIAR